MNNTIPEWPEGVIGEANGVYDQHRKRMFALNATGLQFVQRVDGEMSIASIAGSVAQQYGIDPKEVTEDAKKFFIELNNRLLVNFDKQSSQILKIRLVLWILVSLLSGNFRQMRSLASGLAGPWQRHSIEVSGRCSLPLAIFRIFWLVLTQLKALRVVLSFGILISCLLLSLSHSLQIGALNRFALYLAFTLLITLSVAFSIAIHEAGHGLVGCWMLKTRMLALGINAWNARVVCPEGSPKQEGWIALWGPLMNIFGFLVFGGCALLFYGMLSIQLILWSIALCVGAGGCSLLADDGRKAWRLFGREESGTAIPNLRESKEQRS